GGGIIIFLTALFTIKSLETYKGNLITKGIYSVLRHPMYLGFILWLFGVPLFYGSYTLFLLAVPFSANVLYWRHLEELELLRRFPDYRKYRKNTLF
ncbi:MAG: methyltransferase family protein, partial [Syntrophothermus sp.]